MARKNKDVDRDPELIADMTLLMLYLLSGKVGRGRSARWVAPTHLDANALDQLVRDKLIEDNGDGSVTFTEQGLDGAQYVHDVFLETADVVDLLEERLLLLALQHTDPKELLNELRGKKGAAGNRRQRRYRRHVPREKRILQKQQGHRDQHNESDGRLRPGAGSTRGQNPAHVTWIRESAVLATDRGARLVHVPGSARHHSGMHAMVGLSSVRFPLHQQRTEASVGRARRHV